MFNLDTSKAIIISIIVLLFGLFFVGNAIENTKARNDCINHFIENSYYDKSNSSYNAIALIEEWEHKDRKDLRPGFREKLADLLNNIEGCKSVF